MDESSNSEKRPSRDKLHHAQGLPASEEKEGQEETSTSWNAKENGASRGAERTEDAVQRGRSVCRMKKNLVTHVFLANKQDPAA